MIANSMLDLVGQTPLVRIGGAWLGRRSPDTSGARATVWAKMEHLNPGGSVKDRICRAMIEDAEARAILRPPGPIVEPTSGNTGIGLAWVCSVEGLPSHLDDAGKHESRAQAALGGVWCGIVLTPAEAQMDGAIIEARKIAERTPGAFMPSQFDNPANPSVHGRTSAHEILAAMEGLSLDAFVCGGRDRRYRERRQPRAPQGASERPRRRCRARVVRDDFTGRARPHEDSRHRRRVRPPELPTCRCR